MNNKMNDQQTLFRTIMNFIYGYCKSLSFNRTEYGFVTASKGNNLYSVKLNETIQDIYAVNSPVINVGDVVIVIICNNNFNTNKYIWGKRPPDIN